jgi:hypothetical protein
LNNYFELVSELEYQKHSDLHAILKKMSDDPFSLDSPKPDALPTPLSFAGNPAAQLAVTSYCLGALEYFANKSKEHIRDVAFEIAMLGTTGISPYQNQKVFNLANIPGKKFSGLQMLSYMYVSWQLFDPTKDTGLDFIEEYQNAKKFFNL